MIGNKAAMKILLSAYACEPDKGSEPAVGWNWAQALVRRGHEVHVITRSNNRGAIKAVVSARHPRLRFSYFDLPGWARVAKHWPGGIYFYYLLWQMGAYRLAKRLHAAEHFDVVQHSTFASYRQPSFMGELGIPFIFGPVGGGETMPPQFRAGLPMAGRVAEFFRDVGNALIVCDPLMRQTFSRAWIIACTTEETRVRIPRRYRSKCIVQPAIGINDCEIEVRSELAPAQPLFLFIGRLLYWKGVHLAIRALAETKRAVPGVTLKIIGQGSDRAWLRWVARDAGVTDAIAWIDARPHDEIECELRQCTALVFPSLHDSGGMVVLEAMAAGVPVVCLDLGGPAAMATPSCGVAIDTRDVSEAAVVGALARAMIRLGVDAEFRARLAAQAALRASELTWDAAVEAVYERLENRGASEQSPFFEEAIPQGLKPS
jgi:glycosyltransferase involved in cell wall biosynthesis